MNVDIGVGRYGYKFSNWSEASVMGGGTFIFLLAFGWLTTDFNALDGYRKYLQIADSAKPFHQAILLANAEIVPAINFDKLDSIDDLIAITNIKQSRKEAVIDESWESRALDVQRYLLAC
mgnify:CR=1 FL=1